jgi:excisionase family DNA binding protein
MNKLLTVQESAELAHVSPQTIKRWIKTGKLKPAIRTGHTVRIAPAELTAKCNVTFEHEGEAGSASSSALNGAQRNERADKLLPIITPYLMQLLADAPEFGEITFSASMHQGSIGRVRVGIEVSRAVLPAKEPL